MVSERGDDYLRAVSGCRSRMGQGAFDEPGHAGSFLCANVRKYYPVDKTRTRTDAQYAALGACIGFGYLAKTYILPFSPVLFALAGLSCQPMKKCIIRVLLGVLTALVVAAPLIAALSLKVGRLSFGEGGTLAYTTAVASQGVATNAPEVLFEQAYVDLWTTTPRSALMDTVLTGVTGLQV